MEQMFYEASAFNGDLSLWDVSNVTTMRAMFREASAFDKATVENWDLLGN